MAILSMLVVSSIAVVKVQTDSVTAESHGHVARILAEKGIALCSVRNIKRNDPLLTQSNPSGTEGYNAKFEALATTFGFNALVNQMIADARGGGGGPPVQVEQSFLGLLFIDVWGLEPQAASFFLNNIVEWVDPDDEVTTLEGWERPNYIYAGFTGRPYNRYFKSLDEVELVQGFEALRTIKPNWKDYFNIWTGASIDIISANAEMLSLASITPSGRLLQVGDAVAIKSEIYGADGQLDTEDDLPSPNPQTLLQQYCLGDPSLILDRYSAEGTRPEYFMIESTGWSGKVALTVKMSLQNKGNSLLLLERTEKIYYSQNE